MFRSDVSVLAKTRAKELPQLHYISHTGSTYTVLWNPAAWDSHISTWRYVRHIMTWHLSSTARVIVPVVATFTAWAAFVCLAEPAFGIKLTMTMAPLTLVSSALALLLTLRTNQSLTRLLEARLAWGKAVLHARILAGMLLTRVCPVNPSAAFLCGRLLSTVGWSLRSSLLGPSVDRDALDSLLPPEEAEWIASQVSSPRDIILFHLIRVAHSYARDCMASLREKQATSSARMRMLAIDAGVQPSANPRSQPWIASDTSCASSLSTLLTGPALRLHSAPMPDDVRS